MDNYYQLQTFKNKCSMAKICLELQMQKSNLESIHKEGMKMFTGWLKVGIICYGFVVLSIFSGIDIFDICIFGFFAALAGMIRHRPHDMADYRSKRKMLKVQIDSYSDEIKNCTFVDPFFRNSAAMDKLVKIIEFGKAENIEDSLNICRGIILNPYQFFENAAKNGDSDAMLCLGNLYAEARDYSKACRWYEKGVLNDNSMCMVNLAEHYVSGTGMFPDRKKAINLLECACGMGNTAAMFKLGDMYINGRNIMKDVPLGRFLISASKGDLAYIEQVKEKYGSKSYKMYSQKKSKGQLFEEIARLIQKAQKFINADDLESAGQPVRNIVENIANYFDPDPECNLFEKLKSMKELRILSKEELNILHKMRRFGNAGNHTNVDYNDIPKSKADVQAMIDKFAELKQGMLNKL